MYLNIPLNLHKNLQLSSTKIVESLDYIISGKSIYPECHEMLMQMRFMESYQEQVMCNNTRCPDCHVS